MNAMKLRGLPLVWGLLLLVSLVTLAYAFVDYSVMTRLDNASLLEQQGHFEEALEQYRTLAGRLRFSPLTKSHFREAYSAAMTGQIRVLYAKNSYDEVIELAESCIQEEIADLGAVYFWSGNAFFQKGINQEVGEDSFSWFHRAQAQFRKGLEHDRDARWSIRYNYELIRTVIEQAEKGQAKEAIKILRPPDPLQRRDRKVEG